VTGRPTKLEPPDPCTIDPAEWEVLTDFSHPVAYSHDVGPAPVGVRLPDEDLVVYRTSQDVVARQGNVCLHRGSQLTLGSIDGDELVCRYHTWRYGPEGRCTRIPFGQAERWGRRSASPAPVARRSKGNGWATERASPPVRTVRCVSAFTPSTGLDSIAAGSGLGPAELSG